MNCRQVQDLYSAVVDQELTPQEISLFEQHLQDCGRCRAEWLLFQKSLAWLKCIDFIPPPPDLLYGIRQKLERGPKYPPIVSRLFRDLASRLSLAWAGALGIAIIAVLIFKTQQPPLPRPEQPSPVPRSTNLPRFPQEGYSPYATLVDYSPFGLGADDDSKHLAPLSGGLIGLLSNLDHDSPPTFDTGHLKPDILLSAQIPDLSTPAALYLQLLSDTKWKVRFFRHDLMVVAMNPLDLPHFKNMLRDHRLQVIFPDPAVPLPRKTVLVALRFF